MTTTATIAPTPDDGRIACEIDGARVHSIAAHLREAHPDTTLEAYREAYPDAPLYSPALLAKAREVKARETDRSGAMSDLFGLPAGQCMTTHPTDPRPIRLTLGRADLDETGRALVPDVDPGFVFQPDLLRSVLMCHELGMPGYLYGWHGTGKTSILEQACARLQKPFLRVQHTENLEEAHVTGMWTVRDGSTEFAPGPLMTAMLEGWTLCLDEYDVAQPGVLAVYQPVLEGKPLVTKDAPPALRVVRPHPDFRLFGTGNTNGSGDETGLYQGTRMGNAANYSRWTVTEWVDYMPAGVEERVLVARAGVDAAVARRFVDLATEVRKAFGAGKLSATISPRELIACADLGVLRGGDYRHGIRLGFSNRLNRVDRQVVDGYSQRLFG